MFLIAFRKLKFTKNADGIVKLNPYPDQASVPN